MTAFNLLQYPALASQRRRFHSRWTSLSGLLVGSLVALWGMTQVQEKRLQRVQEGALLQSRVKLAQKQLATDTARLSQQNTWLQQASRVQALSQQQRRWEALHQTLLEEAGPNSVQLLRLQLDGQTLELHGQAKDVPRMAQARARWSVPLATPEQDAAWSLVSLVNASAAEGVGSSAPLEFVWQTAWPLVGSGLTATATAPNRQVTEPQSAEAGKARP
jgi:Tfp pilus assembly protein PilN